jgi:hypothetical protein
MKKNITLIFIAVFFYLTAYTQPYFNKIYRTFTLDSTGQQSATTFYSMRVVNNNIYTAGISTTRQDSVISQSGIFTSFDMSGNLLKNTYFGVNPTNSDFADDVMWVEPNNQFSLIGFNYDFTSNFVKIDRLGNTLFQKVFTNSSTNDFLGRTRNFVRVHDKYAFVTFTARPPLTGPRAVVHITDTLGNTQKVVEFSTTEIGSRGVRIIKNKKNNLVVCSSHTSKSSTDTNYINFSELREIDTVGNTLWVHYTPRNRFVYFKKIIELANGNYLVGGDEEISINNIIYRENIEVSTYLAEINPQRGLIWEKRFGIGIKSRMQGLKILRDSSIILTAFYDDGPNNTTTRLYKFNRNKDSLYSRNFRATSITSGHILHTPTQIEELANGDLVIGGWAQDLYNRSLSVTSGQWGWLVRTDSLGCSLQPSSCRTPTKELEKHPLSINAYPNPTSGSLTIDFEIPTAFKTAEFSLIDIAGREVLHQKIDAEQKQVVWQTESLHQGLYFIILRIDNRIVSQTKVSVQK